MAVHQSRLETCSQRVSRDLLGLDAALNKEKK